MKCVFLIESDYSKEIFMAKGKAGRKPVQIDLIELEKLSSLHCTNEELADWFGVSIRTIETRRKRP